jgi:hypothetical protein
LPASPRDHGRDTRQPDPRQLAQHRLDELGPPAAIDTPTAFLMVGLPGAGKTVRAKELAAEHRALLLTPDAWMIPLFGQQYESESWAASRDVLEGRLIALAIEALRLNVSVVLDFGLWGRDERSALRSRQLSRRFLRSGVHAGGSSHTTQASSAPTERRARTEPRYVRGPARSMESPVSNPRLSRARGARRAFPARWLCGLVRLGSRTLAISGLTLCHPGGTPIDLATSV